MLCCSVLYLCKSAEREKLQLLRPLQAAERERNCSYYDRFKSAEREELHLLRPLQVCRERETATTDCEHCKASAEIFKLSQRESAISEPTPGASSPESGRALAHGSEST